MSNTADVIWEHARSAPDRVGLRGDTRITWTYADLWDRAAAIAGRLLESGVKPGGRVLLVAPSVPEFVGAYFGIHAAGAIAVTANTMAPRAELEYIGQDAGVAAILGWHRVTPAPQQTAAALGVPYWALTPDMADITTSSPPDAPHPTDDEDTATLLYTSGTTGRPKGAQLTHGNILACGSIFAGVHEMTAEDRGGTALPLFHVMGQVCVLGPALQAGASVTLLERFDPQDMLAMLRRDKLTFMAGVPTMWNAILHAADNNADRSDFANLRLAASGGASLPIEVMRAFEDRFDCPVVEGYGLTETAGAATFHTKDRPPKQGSVGRALPGLEIAVRNEHGDELPADEVGEVYIRGPVIMKGYWNRPEATAETLADGWLRTGDLGAKDADGDLRIVDRKKDLVIRGGYNVYPREVEEVLYEHPDIVEAAVIGVPDEHYGEEVAAVIALRPGAALTTPELRSWAKERLSAYKVPHLVAFVDELPKGATGKILKRAIDRGIFARGETPVSQP